MIFVGDWAPQGDNVSIDLDDDLLILNLEGPLVTEQLSSTFIEFSQSLKSGPLLWSHHLPEFNGNIVYILANNHFSDLGSHFAKSTIGTIVSEGNSFCGYGDNKRDSRTPIYFQYQGQNVGLLSISEKQFGEASANSPGIANIGPWVYEKLIELRNSCDFVVVSVHAGAEDFPWPLPFWQDQYRSYITCGADLVIAHHPHIPQGFEHFENGFIAYGLGNFAVKAQVWENSFGGLWSLGIQVNFSDKGPIIKVLYLQQSKEGTDESVMIVHETDDLRFLKFIGEQNAIIAKPDLLSHIWEHLSKDLWNEYLKDFYQGVFLRQTRLKIIKAAIKKILGYIFRFSFPDSQNKIKMLAYHGFSCETHHQIAIMAMAQKNCLDQNLCKETKDLIFNFRRSIDNS